MKGENSAERWTFLTNHARVLICVGRSPDARVRDIASQVGITERQVQAIISDLDTSGYLSRDRVGRRNHYRIHRNTSFRHPFESPVDVGALLDLFPETQSVGDNKTRPIRLAIQTAATSGAARRATASGPGNAFANTVGG